MPIRAAIDMRVQNPRTGVGSLARCIYTCFANFANFGYISIVIYFAASIVAALADARAWSPPARAGATP